VLWGERGHNNCRDRRPAPGRDHPQPGDRDDLAGGREWLVKGILMRCCVLCHYLFDPAPNRDGPTEDTCPGCAVRTTAADRRVYFIGRPLFYPYLDAG
jgi:hypothetical protein